MINNLTIREINKKNQRYIPKIAQLEDIILFQMENNGQAGQFFPTGEEDIREYALSDENIVFAAIDERTDDVSAAVYITQGQMPYTYNDLTKYFKFGEEYNNFVRSQYPSKDAYLTAMINNFAKKIQAYKYAKDKILEEYPEGTAFEDLVLKEKEENNFHEKSKIRDLLNKYMSSYIMEQNSGKLPKEYEYFYWTSLKDIESMSGNTFNFENADYKDIYKEAQECDKVIGLQKYKIYETPKFYPGKYYGANTTNTLEIDTYISKPDKRSSGMARIIVYEGLKRALEKYFADKSHDKIHLCSTLHRENVSSKYVSEFFGLMDSLYLERRQGRDREVHFTSVSREQYKSYIENIGKKLAVLYGYNPDRLQISKDEQIRITEEQIKYDYAELKRLESLEPKKESNLYKRLVGKKGKIKRLKEILDNLTKKQRAKGVER